MKRRAILWKIALLALSWGTTISLNIGNTREQVPGVLDTNLPGKCEFWHFTLRSEQPFRTFVLACLGEMLQRANS